MGLRDRDRREDRTGTRNRRRTGGREWPCNKISKHAWQLPLLCAFPLPSQHLLSLCVFPSPVPCMLVSSPASHRLPLPACSLSIPHAYNHLTIMYFPTHFHNLSPISLLERQRQARALPGTPCCYQKPFHKNSPTRSLNSFPPKCPSGLQSSFPQAWWHFCKLSSLAVALSRSCPRYVGGCLAPTLNYISMEAGYLPKTHLHKWRTMTSRLTGNF